MEQERRLIAELEPQQRTDHEDVSADDLEAPGDLALEPGMHAVEERCARAFPGLVRDPVELALTIAREQAGKVHLVLGEHVHREVRRESERRVRAVLALQADDDLRRVQRQ